MNILVTGGAGFIGSAVCRRLIAGGVDQVLNLDKLTYAGNESSLISIQDNDHYQFFEGDIADIGLVSQILNDWEVDAVMNLAAESHVDRSIEGPAACIETNIVGTFKLLEAVRGYWGSLQGARKAAFRFHQVSTDEVYGDLPYDSGIFTEETSYAPSSPYSASKASADHLVRAWFHTYQLPVVISNCSNNYGYFHFPEKLIPLTILNALHGVPITVYGSGMNIRDWLHVDDHAAALELILKNGIPGETYNVGGDAERTNLNVVQQICAILDKKAPRSEGGTYSDLIRFDADRPGHDRRYAIDASKIKRELDWKPSRTFEKGLEQTVEWYLDNEWWWRPIREHKYGGKRLGTLEPQTDYPVASELKELPGLGEKKGEDMGAREAGK